MAEERFRAVLSAAFGFTALVLAAVGLYGVIARRTAGRRRQFGIRVALGARPADVSAWLFATPRSSSSSVWRSACRRAIG